MSTRDTSARRHGRARVRARDRRGLVRGRRRAAPAPPAPAARADPRRPDRDPAARGRLPGRCRGPEERRRVLHVRERPRRVRRTAGRRGKGSTGTGSRGSGGGFAGFAGAGGFGGGAAGGLTTGEVSYLSGNTLYVTTAEGNTVKVTAPAGTTVSKTVSTDVKSIHPGDTVLVRGSQSGERQSHREFDQRHPERIGHRRFEQLEQLEQFELIERIERHASALRGLAAPAPPHPTLSIARNQMSKDAHDNLRPRSHRRRRPLLAALMIAVAALALAACGSSGGSNTTTNSASTTKAGGSGSNRFASVRACLAKEGITLPSRPAGRRHRLDRFHRFDRRPPRLPRRLQTARRRIPDEVPRSAEKVRRRCRVRRAA